MICVEYLAIFPRDDSFCDSAAAFVRLLQVDSNILIQGTVIQYRGGPRYELKVTAGDVKGKKQRYFHIQLEWNASMPEASDSEKNYTDLLKALRATVAQTGGDTEILRDDVSAYYAASAYPLIYEVETLLRRLIAKFMLITVGREWVDEALPPTVEEAVKKYKRRTASSTSEFAKTGPKDYVNVLHGVDFIHLGEFLFTPYPNRSGPDLYARLKDTQKAEKREEALKALQLFIPQSNWTRYFKGVVGCDDSYLDTRWKQLYELRCKVAHNTMVVKADYESIQRLVGEVKPKLEEAVSKLSGVTVPPEDIELVAERAAGSVNTALGEFIANWQQMEAGLSKSPTLSNAGVRRIFNGNELVKAGILLPHQVRAYDELRQFRNRVVHGPITEIPMESLHRYLANLRVLRERIEMGDFLGHLRTVSKEELNAEVEELIADTKDDILEAEAFCSKMAETNASGYSVDDYEITSIALEDDLCVVGLRYSASGEQHEDRMLFGSKIDGRADAYIDDRGRVTYENVTAEVDDSE